MILLDNRRLKAVIRTPTNDRFIGYDNHETLQRELKMGVGHKIRMLTRVVNDSTRNNLRIPNK